MIFLLKIPKNFALNLGSSYIESLLVWMKIQTFPGKFRALRAIREKDNDAVDNIITDKKRNWSWIWINSSLSPGQTFPLVAPFQSQTLQIAASKAINDGPISAFAFSYALPSILASLEFHTPVLFHGICWFCNEVAAGGEAS